MQLQISELRSGKGSPGATSDPLLSLGELNNSVLNDGKT